MNPAIRLLLSNRSWAQERRAIDPTFFTRLARGQRPAFLWISCSDSRLPANEITATDPGELFVHRNIANLVGAGDANVLSVVQYAVESLGVDHVVICGHYGCGGVRAALAGAATGHLASWLAPVTSLVDRHRAELDALPEEARADRLVELSALAQLGRLATLQPIVDAWSTRGRPYLHAWVYSLQDGHINPLRTLTPDGPVTLMP